MIEVQATVTTRNQYKTPLWIHDATYIECIVSPQYGTTPALSLEGAAMVTCWQLRKI
jgi:hypothetical protein